MTFQRRRFIIGIYTLVLILSVIINICIFDTKADDSMICPLQYENLECYSDKQGKIITLQRGNGQTIIGSSKSGDPITYGCEYDFSKKCENSIYLFKNHEDTENEPLKRVDVAVYSIAKHEIYFEKTLDISIPDPKNCAVLKGGTVCVVSSKFRKNMFICKCSTGKMKVQRLKNDVSSISASPDGASLYAKLAEKNKIVVYGGTSFKETNTIELEEEAEPNFLNENVFMDAEGGTYIKNENTFVSFAKFDIFDGHMCFDDPYLIYASASDKINFVDVTSREEYASMKVDGEIVYIAVCGNSFVYVVKRDDKLFCNKMKSDDAISKISLAVLKDNKVAEDKLEENDNKMVKKSEEKIKDQELQSKEESENAMSTKKCVHENDISEKEEVINLVAPEEVKHSFDEIQTQIEQKEIEQNLEDIVRKQTEVLNLDAIVESLPEDNVLIDQADIEQTLQDNGKITEEKIEASIEQLQTQIEKKEVEQNLSEVVRKTEILSERSKKSNDLENIKAIESIHAQVEQNEIQSELDSVVDNFKSKQNDEIFKDSLSEVVDDVIPTQVNMIGKKWIPLKINRGLFDSTQNDILKDKVGKYSKDTNLLLSRHVLSADHGDKKVLKNPTKLGKAVKDRSQIRQGSLFKKSKGVKLSGKVSQSTKSKGTRHILHEDGIDLDSSKIMVNDTDVNITQEVSSEEHKENIFPINKRTQRNDKLKKPKVKKSEGNIAKVKQSFSQKGKLCKSKSDRSIPSQLSVQKKKEKMTEIKITADVNKRRICLRDVRERISKSNIYNLDLKKNFICGVDMETSFSQFKKNLDLASDVNVLFKKKGKPMKNGNIGTNTIIEFDTYDVGTTNLIAVVPGDLTGSGKTNKLSLKMMCRHIFKEKLLEGAYFEAGDINGDGVVDTLDLLLLSKMIDERA